MFKLLGRYLRSKAGTVLLFVLFAAVMAFSFTLYHLPAEAVLYPAALCAILGLTALVIGFIHTLHMHKLISDIREMDTELPEVRNIEAADYREIVRLLQEQSRDVRTRAETDMAAMMDYYTLWVHQIKTPIASMRLRLQEEDTPQARVLLSDLSRIERYVSMVLTYLRLEGGSTDYVIREYDLDSILRPVFKQFAGEFISRKLKLDYTPVNVKVLTDENGFPLWWNSCFPMRSNIRRRAPSLSVWRSLLFCVSAIQASALLRKICPGCLSAAIPV